MTIIPIPCLPCPTPDKCAKLDGCPEGRSQMFRKVEDEPQVVRRSTPQEK
jgi:hypothetical protein